MSTSESAPWFAFVVHPRSVADLLEWRGSKLLRQYSESDEDFARKASGMDPVVAGDVRFGVGGMRGELIGVMRFPEQLLTPYGRTAVLEGVQLAISRGARVIGLGALTAPATVAGRAIVKSIPPGFILTTGNAYTSAVARHNVREAVSGLGLGDQVRVAVLGATGSVGVPLSRMLVSEGHDVTLVGRTLAKVGAALPDLVGKAHAADSTDALSDADIVVVVTSGASALVRPEHVRAGSIVIDLTQPSNIDPDTYDEFTAKGVQIAAGGLVRIPGYRATYALPTGDDRTTFACLAETYLMAKEGIRDHSVGVPSEELATRLERIASIHGVIPKGLGLKSKESGAPGRMKMSVEEISL